MRILLTGASGLIGSYVLQYLLQQNINTNILVRDPAKFNSHISTDLNIYEGNVIDYETVQQAIKDCDIVIHLAAYISAAEDNPAEFEKTNVDGTKNLLKAAVENNVEKFIFSSSLAAHQYLQHSIINEESLIYPEKYFSKYAETKAKAERLVIKYSKYGLPYVIIFPTRVFGIGPLTDANGATKAVYLYLKNRLPFLIDGGEQYSNWSFVEDVAKGIILTATTNVTNQLYILGGENKTLVDVYRIADRLSGKNHFKLSIKSKSAMIVTSGIEQFARLTNTKPLVTKEWLGYLLESYKISSGKAVAELNYAITPFDNALSKTISWIKSL